MDTSELYRAKTKSNEITGRRGSALYMFQMHLVTCKL